MDPYITFDDPTLNIKSYLGSDYVVEYISSKLWYNHNYFLENYDHLPIKDIYIYIYIYIYTIHSLPKPGDAKQILNNTKFGL